MKGQEPRNTHEALAHLSEECAEVIVAVGKCQRWGLSSVNPFLVEAKRELEVYSDNRSVPELVALVERMHPGETNEEWLLREIDDVEMAAARLRKFLKESM